jgi:hypothetical protein
VQRLPKITLEQVRQNHSTFSSFLTKIKSKKVTSTELPAENSQELTGTSRKLNELAKSYRKWQEITGSGRKLQEVAGSFKNLQKLAASRRKSQKLAGTLHFIKFLVLSCFLSSHQSKIN